MSNELGLSRGPRYLVTRMVKDPRVAPRYQRSGYMAFDTRHTRHGQVWPTKAEAEADAERLNRATELIPPPKGGA